MKKRVFSSSSSSSFARKKKKRSSFALYPSLSLPLSVERNPSAKLVLEPGVWEPLFPSLDKKQITRLLRTNKEIQKVALDYLETLPLTCYKETGQWSLLCLDPRYGECLSECLLFGFEKVLNHLHSLLGTKVTFQDKEEQIYEVRFLINETKKGTNPEIFFEYANDINEDEEMIYKETFYFDDGLEIQETEWGIQEKDKILSRVQEVLQHKGATVDLILLVSNHHDHFHHQEVELFSQKGKGKGQSLGIFHGSPTDFGEIRFVRRFFVHPRQKRFLAPLVSLS